MHNPFTLQGKTVLVTGASSGIGRSVAIECAKMGAVVMAVGRDSERLKETFDNLEGDGHRMFCADLTVEESVADLVNGLPVLHGFANAAGVLRILPFRSQKPKALRDIMEVNFIAPSVMTSELLARKKISANASIVYISSISGNNCSYAGNTAYSSSEGALNAMSRNIALELAPRGIRVNTVNPGIVETKMVHTALAPEQFWEDIGNYPLKRYGRPEDVAYAVIYLLSDASSWVTGSELVLDGGYTLK